MIGQQPKKLVPTAAYVFVIKPEKAGEQVRPSGVYVPPNDKEKKNMIVAEVAAVGPETKLIAVGDIVVIDDYAFDLVKIQDTEYLAGKEENVLALLQ